MWLKKGPLILVSEQASVTYGVEFPLEYMGSGFAKADKSSLLNKNPLIQNLKVVAGVFIAMPGCFFRIFTLLNLAFNPFESRLETVLTLLHGSVAERSSFSKGSRKDNGREILPSLVFQFFKNW